jgi:hypothetical protein
VHPLCLSRSCTFLHVCSFFIGNASTPAVRYGSSTANVVIMDADVGGNLRVASGMINVKVRPDATAFTRHHASSLQHHIRRGCFWSSRAR